MSIEDETLRLYIEESVEHLADIENDLLAIEDDGADIDEKLVNKVFRAAHSIKGGAGFMGLNNIKELSHRMENVLGMIREREMVPNPEIINILLLASDTLRNLLNNVEESNNTDISDHLQALIGITTNIFSEQEKDDLSNRVDVASEGGKHMFSVSRYDISNARKKGNFIYLVEYELIHDIHNKERSPLDLIKKLEESGVILESRVDINAVGTLEEDVFGRRIPFMVLFGTILEPAMVNALLDVEEAKIYELTQDYMLKPVGHESIEDIKEAVKPVMETLGQKCGPVEVAAIKNDIPPLIENNISNLYRQQTRDQNKVKSTKDMKNLDSSLRVNVSLLDSLMNLAGELVLGRNQLLQAIGLKDVHAIDASGQRLDLITSELQETIMMTRMQPIGNVFNKFPRVVRDLARDLGKEVRLSIEGESVELDKTILEAINDPLTHLVRNSVDHGLEVPEERRKAGKDVTGHVVLKAYHEAGQVNIEIQDDGKGIDPDRLSIVALEKNLITEEQAATMSDKEKINLIFLPGFSTADQISEVSGRGVGMDVVKTNLDKLGGVVDIDSALGHGTRIKIKLPLTLAIIPSQLISVAGEKYAIPQVNLEELFRIPAGQVKERIEKVGHAEVVRLRGNLLPLIRLSEVIGIEGTYIDPNDNNIKKDRRRNLADRRSRYSPLFNKASEDRRTAHIMEMKTEDSEKQNDSDRPHDKENISGDRRNGEDRRYHAVSAVNIVVVNTGAIKYGMVVDQLHDSEEIVVKPLGRHLKQCKGYAGATIMGDGRVALILDVAGLARMAELTSLEGTDRVMEVAREQTLKSRRDVQSLLIFRNAEDEQFAVSLGLVERIEKIRRSNIEEVGGKKVMQYRGASLPLFSIEEAAKVKPLADKEDLLVFVFIIGGKDIGLLATPPLDAIEESVKIDDRTLKQSGIMGSAIIDNRTTLIVDIFDLVKVLNPEWFDSGEIDKVQSADVSGAIILYAEDSNFFRNQVKEFLLEDGYKVIEAEDGQIAWDLMRKHGSDISLIITDIEMPNMDGFDFVKKVREDKKYSKLPIIALTTMASDEDIRKGSQIGINDYQIKLDKEKLMESVRQCLKGY